MLYKEKLVQCLKNENNAINKMYLNELLINWKKVETSIEESKESPIWALVSAISTFTKYLTLAKFKYNPTKKCGFTEDHDVFQGHYLYDIVEAILNSIGVKNEEHGLKINNKPFNSGFRLERASYKKLAEKPKFEFFSSGKHLHVGLEFDLNYKLTSKKHYNRVKILVPIIVFYIDKYFSERSFEEIKQLKKESVAINSNALLICVTESVDRKLLHLYTEFTKHLYILRANFKDEGYNDLQPGVCMNLQHKLQNFVNKEYLPFERIVKLGALEMNRKEKP